jgi:NaMN:DMB phosphoribosyltransferase
MTAYPGNTLVHSAVATAPTLNQVIASIAAPPEGVYRVGVTIILTGTAETATRNLTVRENGSGVINLLPTLSGAGPLVFDFPQVEINPGGGNLDVIANAGATAGSVYSVILQATRIG